MWFFLCVCDCHTAQYGIPNMEYRCWRFFSSKSLILTGNCEIFHILTKLQLHQTRFDFLFLKKKIIKQKTKPLPKSRWHVNFFCSTWANKFDSDLFFGAGFFLTQRKRNGWFYSVGKSDAFSICTTIALCVRTNWIFERSCSIDGSIFIFTLRCEVASHSKQFVRVSVCHLTVRIVVYRECFCVNQTRCPNL